MHFFLVVLRNCYETSDWLALSRFFGGTKGFVCWMVRVKMLERWKKMTTWTQERLTKGELHCIFLGGDVKIAGCGFCIPTVLECDACGNGTNHERPARFSNAGTGR